MTKRRRLRGLAPVRPMDLLQAAATLAGLARLARAGRRPPPPRPGELPAGATVSVVVAVRDQTDLIGPCLDPLGRDPQVLEVLVVDDRSAAGTAEVARAAGAKVVAGEPSPPGWDRGRWALARGVRQAAGDWVLALDPAARPEPGLAGAAVTAALARGDDLLLITPRYQCADPVARVLHPSMLAAGLYRGGPLGAGRLPSPGPTWALGDGACLLFRRAVAGAELAAAGDRPGGEPTLAGQVAAGGGRVGWLDGTNLLTVVVGGQGGRARGWGWGWGWGGLGPWPGSGDPAPSPWWAADLAGLWLTLALPPLRLLTGHGTGLDLALVAARFGVAATLRRRYAAPGPALWLSPLADLPVTVRLTWSALRRERRSRKPPGARQAGACEVAAPHRPLSMRSARDATRRCYRSDLADT